MRRKGFIALALVFAFGIAGGRGWAQCDSIGLPWMESFDSYGTGVERLPDCWVAMRNYDVGYLPHLDASRHRSGTASLVLYPGTLAGSHYSMAIAPPLAGSSTFDGLFLRFYFLSTSTAARLVVGFCADTGRYTRDFVPIDTLHVNQGNRWQEVLMDLSGNPGTRRRLAFRMERGLQPDGSAVYIDDVHIGSCGTSEPTVSHVGSTQLTLHFGTYGTGTVTVAYGNDTVRPAFSPLVLTGLTPDSLYRFSVSCSDGDTQSVEVRTLENSGIGLAYYEDFNATDSVVPRHWRRPTANKPQVAGGVLRMMPTEGDSCMAVLPLPVGADLSELTMALTVAATGNVRLVVGVVEFPDEADGFVPIDTIAAGARRQEVVPLSSYSGDARYPALLAVGNGTLTVDDLRLARCLLANQRLYNLTDSEVTVAWDTLMLADSATVEIEYGPQGFARGSETLLAATTNPLTLSGLMSNTAYDIYILPSCGDEPARCDRLTFRTFAHEVSAPYCEGFEADANLPQGWTGSGSVSITTNAYAGSRALALDAGASVTLPLLGSTTPDTCYLQFYAISNATIYLGRRATPYDPVTVTDTLTGYGSWHRYTVAVVGAAGNCLSLSAAGTCRLDMLSLRTSALGDATVSAIGQTSAHVAWGLLHGDSAVVEYARLTGDNSDFAPGGGTTVVADTALTLTGLQPDTRYALHIAPYDGGSFGACGYTTLSFTTMAAPFELPFCQNFDAMPTGSYPTGWRRLSEVGEYPIVSTGRNLTGGRSLLAVANNGQHTVAVLPDATGGSAARSVAFWANAASGHDAAQLLTGYMTDISDMSTFTAVDTMTFTDGDRWVSHIAHLDSVPSHLAMMIASTGSTVQTYLENICVESCIAYDIHVSGIDSTSLTVSWQATDSLSLICQISGGGVNRVDTLRHSPTRLTGLDNNTPYTLYFTTLCDCGFYGAAYISGYGSSGDTTNHGRTGLSINTRPPTFRSPYCNTFEGGQTGWKPGYWSGQASINDRNCYGGNHSAKLTGGSFAILPPIDDVRDNIVSMMLYGSHESLLSDSAMVVGVMTAPDTVSSFVPTDTVRLTALGEWQHVVANLAGYSGSGRYIALRPAGGSGTLYIDNIAVAACGIGEGTATSEGTIGWRTWHGTDKVAIEYGPTGFSPGNGTYDTAICTPGETYHTHTIAGFAANESHDIYLTPLCDSGDNCQQLKLTTGATIGIPYCEPIDGILSEAMPNGWAIGRSHNGTPTMATVNNNQCMLLAATPTSRSIAVLPKLAAESLEGHELTLNLRTDNVSRALLIVGRMANTTDANTFVPIDTLTATAANSWQVCHASLHGFIAEERIAIAATSTTGSVNIWVDNIVVTRGHTPTLSVTSARSVTLSNDIPDYYIEYAPVGTPQGSGTTVHITDSVYRLGGLLPQQSYRFYHSADSVGTCLAPQTVTLPAEEPLPYCHRRDTVSSLTLPELAIDSLQRLHLYFSLRGGTPVEVGVLSRRDSWESFTAVDTATATGGTWHRVHVSFAGYDGDGHFVALRTIGGGNAVIDSFSVVACELPRVTLRRDNNIIIEGLGAVEYGPAGFSLGSGTTVTAPDSVRLDNNQSYDFYPLCDSGAATCALPQRIVTAMDRCELPDSLTVAQPGNGRVMLGWDAAYSGFWLEYTYAGLPQGSGTTVQLDTPPLTLVLDPDTAYSLFLRCDSAEMTGRAPQRITTLTASAALPYCTGFEEDMAGWRVMTDRSGNYATVESGSAHSGTRRLTVRNSLGTTYLVLPQPDVDSLRRIAVSFYARLTGSNSHSLTLGAMSDANDPQSFDSLASWTSLRGSYHRCFHSLEHYYGNGTFLALRLSDDDIAYIDDLTVGTCAAYNFVMSEMDADHVVLEWGRRGEPQVMIVYGPRDSAAASYDTLRDATSPCRIGGLSPLTNYTFYVSHSCESCDTAFSESHRDLIDTLYSFTPQGGTGCIDYTDLHASYVTCSYGSYDNPTDRVGAVDHGYMSAESRHTVHFDTAERDARTGGLLRTIPTDEKASVRLGNWRSGGNVAPEAECITYGMAVDAAEADLLVLRYAAVLQDPEHSPTLQPRFRLEILNQYGRLIDSCSLADFIANADLGWNRAANEVLWKDWTTVGIDLTHYDGQTIFVRLTTRDCGEGSHFGYAYFTLRCTSRRMQSEGCSDVPNNRFTVPTGFNYRWYSSADTTATLSDSSSIWVRSDNSVTYYCQLSFVDNPQCHFTMNAFAGARYPLALFDTALTVADCQFTLQLTNRSTISGDGVTPLGTDEPVESLLWLLPDSTVSTAQNPVLHIADTGTVDITLIAGIADDQCIDTLQRTIVVRRPYPAASLEGRSERCRNDATDTVRAYHVSSYGWVGGAFESPATIDSNSVTFSSFATVDSTLTCITVDSNGCRDTLRHTISVHPTYYRHYADSVCSSIGQYGWLDTTLLFVTVDTDSDQYARIDRLTEHGCDSTMTLSLHIWPTYYPQQEASICDNFTHTFFDTVLNTTGIYIHNDSTTVGCDSIVTIDFTVMERRFVDDPHEVCDSLRWIDGQLYTADTTGVSDTLTTYYGCDSIVSLQLIVNSSYFLTYSDTVCSSDLSYQWLDTTVNFTPADQDLQARLDRVTARGCDSTMTLSLNLWPAYYPEPRDTICDDGMLTFYDTVLNTAGRYTHDDSTQHGCDSIVTLTLTVMQRRFTSESLVACDSLRWIDGKVYTSDTSGVKDTLLTSYGCDSIVTLTLRVNYSFDSIYFDTFCASSGYWFQGQFFSEGGIYSDTMQTVERCDSVLSVALTRLEIPQLLVDTLYNCGEENYTLVAHSSTPYLMWNADRDDSLLDGRRRRDSITVAPTRTTTYTIYTDYGELLQCPETKSVTLHPFSKPVAQMRITPQQLAPGHLSFEARDVSGENYVNRIWYVDSTAQESGSYLFRGEAAEEADTVEVWMVVYDGHCSDTAIALLPVQRSNFALPNAFTPGGESNSHFTVNGYNIASYEISIYNRRGVLVYHSEEMDEGWDGRSLAGDECPTGSYVYHIRYSTVFKPTSYQKIVGSVLLIR